jgi:hypothetical protein
VGWGGLGLVGEVTSLSEIKFTWGPGWEKKNNKTGR